MVDGWWMGGGAVLCVLTGVLVGSLGLRVQA